MEKTDKLNQRSDKFTIIFNDNELNMLKNPKHIINKIMCDEKIITFIAVIYHNRDTRDDDKSSLKTPHYHMVIAFEGRYRVETILNWLSDLFKINKNQIQIEKCNSIEMQTRYLMHLDDLDKVPYTIDEVETGYGMRDTLNRYTKLQIIKDLSDLVKVVNHYHYELETIMTTIAHYDKWRKYILDLINNYYRRR